MKKGYFDKIIPGICQKWDCSRPTISYYASSFCPYHGPPVGIHSSSLVCRHCGMSGSSFNKHNCSNNICGNCGFGHDPILTTCITQQCDNCELWFRDVKKHVKKCRQPTCQICDTKVKNIASHVEKKHPNVKALQELKTPLPDDLIHIIASYSPAEKMNNYCCVCLKMVNARLRHACDMYGIYQRKRPRTVKMTNQQVRQVKKLRISQMRKQSPDDIRKLLN